MKLRAPDLAQAAAVESAALDAQTVRAAWSLPARCYVDADFAQRERRTVFSTGWQLVAHAEQLNGSGDHIVTEIGGVPLLLVRGAPETDSPKGRLRALHNVCRHRAGPLALCDGRGARALICRYHGWTYALDGRLSGAPEMSGAADFDVARIALPQARVAEWQGLVFCGLGSGEQPLPEFEEIAAPVGARSGSLSKFRFSRRISYEIACNWKVYVDNFLEGYHLARVHPSLNRLLDYRSYRTELGRWHVLQASPLDATQGPYGSTAESNVAGSANEALYWWLWPNTMLNVLPDRLQTNRVVPLGPERCRVDFEYFYPPEADAALAERDHAFADKVQAEDIAICEAVQRGLASGSYVAGRLNPDRESGVWHFQQLLRAAYAE